MSRSGLLRVAAYAGLGSAILAVIALVGFVVVVGSGRISEAASSPSFFAPAGAALAAIVLLGVALVGLLLRQQERLTSTGVAGFVVALVGTLLAAGAQWTYVFVVPHFSEAVPGLIDEGSGSVLVGFGLSYLVLAVGWVIFGFATLKADVFPRRAGWSMIVGGAISCLPLPSRTLVLSLAVAYAGTHLLRHAERDLSLEDDALASGARPRPPRGP